MFKVGQKVVCVNDIINSETARWTPLRPKMNEVYTVASIHMEDHIGGYGVRLEELRNPSIVWSDGDDAEWSFDHRRFRPLVAGDQVASSETGGTCDGTREEINGRPRPTCWVGRRVRKRSRGSRDCVA